MPQAKFNGKTFAGNKPIATIFEQCQAQGLEVVRTSYDRGGDHIGISGGGCTVVYNVFNGRFWGDTPSGDEFSSDSVAHETDAWFQALLAFFYAEADPRAATPLAADGQDC